jgi:hypothetical protein
MQNWKDSMKHGLVSGATASVLSTVALAICGRRETGSASAPTNAISHWIWGDKAARHKNVDPRYTLPGYVIHHASATFWAVLLEKCFGAKINRDTPLNTLKVAAVTSAVACFVDYKMTPHRLQPGYEMHLSKPSLFMVYAAFGLGLALGAHALKREDHRTGEQRND